LGGEREEKLQERGSSQKGGFNNDAVRFTEQVIGRGDIFKLQEGVGSEGENR